MIDLAKIKLKELESDYNIVENNICTNNAEKKLKMVKR